MRNTFGLVFGALKIAQRRGEFVHTHEDRVQAVGDGEHCRVREVLADGLLDSPVRFLIDCTRRFVHEQHSGLAKKCPSQTDQLALADGEIAADA